MAVTIKWTGLFRPMQKYKKGETGEWERLRNLGTVAGTVAKNSFQEIVFASDTGPYICIRKFKYHQSKNNKTHGKAK
ncbi:MAG: hypothetical protein MR873_03535 [Parabacteroides sp.]|nr:hypothetical protein [Parabacteroides sp.]